MQRKSLPLYRHRRWIAAVSVLVLGWQFVSSFRCAEVAMPVAGIGGLVDFRLLTGKSFAAIQHGTWTSLSAAQQVALTNWLGRQTGTVYLSAEDVPETQVMYEPITDSDVRAYEILRNRRNEPGEIVDAWHRNIQRGKKPVAFKDGILFGWRLQRRGLFWMKCASSSWVSGTGAEGRVDLFIWCLGRWIRVYTFSHHMA